MLSPHLHSFSTSCLLAQRRLPTLHINRTLTCTHTQRRPLKTATSLHHTSSAYIKQTNHPKASRQPLHIKSTTLLNRIATVRLLLSHTNSSRQAHFFSPFLAPYKAAANNSAAPLTNESRGGINSHTTTTHWQFQLRSAAIYEHKNLSMFSRRD